MAIEAYPVGADSGFSEESAINSERDRLIAALGGRMADFIVAPFSSGHFDESHSGSSYDITIDTGGNGLAFLGGHLVENDAAITLTLDASTTNEIFLVVRDAATGNAEVVFTSDGTTPSGQHVMKIWEATTDGSGVTGTTDFRKYIAFPNLDPDESVTGLKETRQGTPDPPSVSTETSGVKTVDVTFDQPYRNHVFGVVATLNSLTDTAVNFGWIRAKNVTTSGFTIEAKVTKTGASGSTADFNWQANGQ